MKKIIYGALATLTGLVLLFSYRTSLGEAVATNAPLDATSPDSSSSSSSDAGSQDTGGTSSTSGLADGTFTGQAASTRYGPVAVRITVSGGTITAVDVPEYPTSNRRDQQINERAIPRLISETLDAQSTSIDMVSGATYTSDGYVRSLQSAIDQAAR